MAKQFDIERFNSILKTYNQQLQAEKITGKEVVLSNGLVLDSVKDVRLCKRRVMSGDRVWKENFDKIYSIDKNQRISAEKECRSLTSIKGGVNCQKEHKEKIKSNSICIDATLGNGYDILFLLKNVITIPFLKSSTVLSEIGVIWIIGLFLLLYFLYRRVKDSKYSTKKIPTVASILLLALFMTCFLNKNIQFFFWQALTYQLFVTNINLFLIFILWAFLIPDQNYPKS